MGVATTSEAPRREKFIPVTRHSLMQRLREEEGLLNWQEREKLESFAAALDAHFSHRFLATLQEAKVRLGSAVGESLPTKYAHPSILKACCIH